MMAVKTARSSQIEQVMINDRMGVRQYQNMMLRKAVFL